MLLIRYNSHQLPVQLKTPTWQSAYEGIAEILGIQPDGLIFQVGGLPIEVDSPLPDSTKVDVRCVVLECGYASKLYHRTLNRAREWKRKHPVPQELKGAKRAKYSRLNAVHDITSAVSEAAGCVHHHLDEVGGAVTERLDVIAQSV